MSKLYRSLLWSGLIVAGVAACGDDVTVTPPAPPPPPPSTPATISIRSITTGNLNTPVLLNNVQGQIDVTLNLDAGTQTVSNVQVLIDGAVACQQGFSAISAAAANQTELDVIPVVCSINTAAFNPTTGVATYLNGARLLTAKVNLVGSAPVATPSTTLIFNNTSIIAITASVTGTSANSASGILWQTGDLVATALPVIYTAGSPTIQQIVLTPTGGLSAKTLTAAPFTATWAKATSIASGGAGSKSGGIELFGLVVNANSTVGGAVGPVGTSNAINFDTKGPPAPTFVANPNSRQNGWINAAVGLAAVNGSSAFPGVPSATDNDWLVNPSTPPCTTGDCGVGGYVRLLRIASGAAGTVDLAIAATGSATPTLPARTLNPTDQCAVATAADLLGNETSLPAAGSTCLSPPAGSFVNTGSQSLRFGVDLDAPTIAFSGGLPALGSTAGRILAATVGTEFQVTVADAGAIGVSGMLGGAPVIGTVVIFNASGTTCFVGTTGACVPAGTGASFTAAFPLVATNTVAAATADGYYTGSFIAQDAAGNQSAAITRSIVHEVAGNPGAMTSAAPTALPLTGSTVTFNALGSDNLDLRDVQYTLTYGGGLANPIQFPLVDINATPPVPATLKNANVSVGITINGFMRQVENVTGSGPLTVGGQFKPTSLDGTLRDQVQASAPVSTGILAGQVTTGVSYLTAAATQLIRSWAITNAATLVSDGATAPVNPTSVTLVADAFGPTATFSAPFTRVDFYADFGGFLVFIGTGTQDITFDDGSAFGRRQRWNFTWTPGTNFAPGVINLYAIGVNANGDALVSPLNANITITTP